jgi:gamma-glutamylcyclotransferase (GGCT)/AIG2-like uncharacterized protein YtfP
MNAAIPFLFVYGSLRKGFQSESYQYISQYFELIGNATTNGFLIDLGSYPAAIPSKGDSIIIGELYQLKTENEHDWAFAQLDDYEGVNVEEGEQQMYRRAIANVTFENKEVLSWIYWYNGDVNGKPIITSGDIFDYIKNKQ